jgi:hypothetical protein
MSTGPILQLIAWNVEVANSLLAVTVTNVGSLLSYTKSISDYSGHVTTLINKVLAIRAFEIKTRTMI